MKTRIIVGTVLAAVVFFQSCTKEETSSPRVTLIEKIVKDIPADTIVGLLPDGRPTGVNKFTFYSFEKNDTVPRSDSNSTKWDIGFKDTKIIINGGTSGPGNGGAFVYVGTFDDLITIPADSTFKVDAAPNLAITAANNRGWYFYNAPVNLVTALPGRVLVFRTATGKYAKVEILNYYKGGTTPAATDPDAVKIYNQRYYSFKYSYQADGTMIFKQ